MLIVAIVTLLLASMGAFGQDCRVRGQSCSHHEYCCGGCCWDQICTEVTRSNCFNHRDPCLDHPCPEFDYCYKYKGCRGCETQVLCLNHSIRYDTSIDKFNYDDSNNGYYDKEFFKLQGADYFKKAMKNADESRKSNTKNGVALKKTLSSYLYWFLLFNRY